MNELPDLISERINALSWDWAEYLAVGSFGLYFTGYLALRFHLSALGVATDLAVIDERYVFTGARFLVNLVAAVPSIVVLALPPWLLGWAVWRLLRRTWRERLAAWRMPPGAVALVGVLFATAMIQLAMRRCFDVTDLLLAPSLPGPAWLSMLLMDGRRTTLYFIALVASCLVTLALLAHLLRLTALTPRQRRGRALLGLLAAIQLLFLPINYGVLIMDKAMARVTAAGTQPLAPGETAWLVWEGAETVTFLVRAADCQQRRLVTHPRAALSALTVVATDPIIPALFDPAAASPDNQCHPAGATEFDP